MLDKYTEIGYLVRLPLKNFIETGAGYRCSCPVCGEGRAGRTKISRRLNFLTRKNEWITVNCFNCGLLTNFREFIHNYFPSFFEEYREQEKAENLKALKNGTLAKKLQGSDPGININAPVQYQFLLNEKYFKPAREFESAVNFCKKRKIIEYIDQFYFNVNPKAACGGMIIFPFYMEDKKHVYGFQGRHPEEKRFHTHSKNDSFKVYNAFGLDKNKTVIAVESLIDSLNIDNCIAMLGSDLSAKIKHFLRDYDMIYAFDSDNTGHEKAVKYGKEGHKVFVWPEMGKIKDFNDLSKLGWSKDDITGFIKKHSYEGIELTARLSFVRKKK